MAFKRIVKDAEIRAVGRPHDLGAAKLVKEEAEELERGVRHYSVLHPPVPVPPHNPPDLLPNLVLEGTPIHQGLPCRAITLVSPCK